MAQVSGAYMYGSPTYSSGGPVTTYTSAAAPVYAATGATYGAPAATGATYGAPGATYTYGGPVSYAAAAPAPAPAQVMTAPALQQPAPSMQLQAPQLPSVNQLPRHLPQQQQAPPQAPVKSSENMPDPSSIEQQKQAYTRALDAQLEEGKRTIREHAEDQKRKLQEQALQAKVKYEQQLEQEILTREAAWDKQTMQAAMQLHGDAHKHKVQLEQQASGLTLEWKQKKLQEDIAMKQYDLQHRAWEARSQMFRRAQQLSSDPQAAATVLQENGHAGHYDPQPGMQAHNF